MSLIISKLRRNNLKEKAHHLRNGNAYGFFPFHSGVSKSKKMLEIVYLISFGENMLFINFFFFYYGYNQRNNPPSCPCRTVF